MSRSYTSAAPGLMTLCCVALMPPAAAQGPGIRNLAMGGAGVASSSPTEAAFANPALTRFRDENTGLSVVLPYAYAAAEDGSQLLDGIDEFQSTLADLTARLDAGDPTAGQLRPFLASRLAALDRRALDADADLGVAVLWPGRDMTLAFSARSFAVGRALPFIDEADIAVINDPNTTAVELDALASDASLAAANVTEFGVTAAYEGAFANRRFSLGVTPKLQWIETYHYGVPIGEFDSSTALDDVRSGRFRTQGSAFNVDAGVAVEIEPGALLGLSVKELIRQREPTVETLGRRFTYAAGPRPTLGVAIERVGMQFTLEVDLRKTGRFTEFAPSQFVRMGFEYSLAGRVQLRTGFAYDLRDAQQDRFSIGLGLAPLRSLRLDAVALLGDDALGAGLQLALAL